MEQVLAIILISIILGMALAGYMVFSIGRDIKNHPINSDKGTGPIAMVGGILIVVSMVSLAIVVFYKTFIGAI